MEIIIQKYNKLHMLMHMPITGTKQTLGLVSR